MAAAEASMNDSMKAMGETLQNLIEVNTAGFVGIQSSLRKEFSSQNKLLGGFLGKNLQLIADALTDSSNDLLRQMQADARAAKEAADEALRAAGAGGDSGGVEAKDMSLDLSITSILAGLAVFLVGFVQGYIAELKLIGTGIKNAIKALGKDAKAIWNFGKSWIANSKFGKWLGSIKNWFNTKITIVLTKIDDLWKGSKPKLWFDGVKKWFSSSKLALWTKIGDMWKGSGVAKWFQSVKAFFVPTIDKTLSMRHHTKIMQESGIMKFYNNIKAWFKRKISFKLPNFKALWPSSAISKFIGGIKGLAGKSAFLDELGKGIARIKNMFTVGGPGLFAQLGTWIKSFKIPFPKWLTDIIAKAKGLTGADSFLGKLGSFFGRLFIWFQVLTAVFDFWGGWTETQGTWWDKLWGGLSAALKGFINSFLDLGIMIEDGIKWIIKKIGGFFGFDEAEIEAAIGDFSIFKPIKEAFNTIVDWVVTLMTDPLAAFSELWAGVSSVGAWIYDMALKPIWDWFEGLFPGAAASLKAAWGAIASIGTWIYDNAIKPVWDWIAGVFGFGDDDKKEDSRSFFQICGDAISSIWDWFVDLFTFGDDDKPAEDEKGMLGYLLDMVTGIWEWFKGLFDFSSIGAGLLSAARLIFLPWTALLDLVGGVWNWFKGIFGFEEPEPEDPRTLSQKLGGLIGDVWDWFLGIFGFGDDDKPDDDRSLLAKLGGLIGDVWTWISDWFTGLWGGDSKPGEKSIWDKIGDALSDAWTAIKSVFDIDWGASLQSLAKTVMPGWMYDWFYDDEAPDPQAEKQPEKPSPTAAKPPSAVLTEADIDKIMNAVDFRMFDFGSIFGYDLNFGQDLKDTLTSTMKGGIPGIAIQKAASGALVGMKMPSAPDLGLEDGGLFTLSAGEMVLDNQAAQTFLAAAQLLTGADLAALQRESNELSGAGSPPIIVNNAPTNVMNENSQPIVMPPAEMAPGNGGAHLPGS